MSTSFAIVTGSPDSGVADLIAKAIEATALSVILARNDFVLLADNPKEVFPDCPLRRTTDCLAGSDPRRPQKPGNKEKETQAMAHSGRNYRLDNPLPINF